MAGCLPGWLAGWHAGWLVGWLAGWPASRPHGGPGGGHQTREVQGPPAGGWHAGIGWRTRGACEAHLRTIRGSGSAGGPIRTICQTQSLFSAGTTLCRKPDLPIHSQMGYACGLERRTGWRQGSAARTLVGGAARQVGLRMGGWVGGCLAGWLAGWRAGWLHVAGWLAGWLLTGWLAVWLVMRRLLALPPGLYKSEVGRPAPPIHEATAVTTTASVSTIILHVSNRMLKTQMLKWVLCFESTMFLRQVSKFADGKFTT
jgi:hypothetical protein